MSKSRDYFLSIANLLYKSDAFAAARMTRTPEKDAADRAFVLFHKDKLFDIYERELDSSLIMNDEEKEVYKEKKFDDFLNDYLNRYDIEGRNETIKRLELIMDSALYHNQIELKHKPYFGQLPTGLLNAQIFKVLGEREYVIVFEDQIFTLALLVAKIFAMCLPLKDHRLVPGTEYDIAVRIHENPIVQQRFYEMIVAYIFQGGVSAAPSYFQEEKALDPIVNNVINTMELFILAHEYGHLIAGHLEEVKTVKLLFGSEPVNEVGFSWQEEFEADTVGYDLLKTIMPDTTWLDVSVNLFFHTLYYLETAERLFFNKDYDPKETRLIFQAEKILTHPHPLLRESYIDLHRKKGNEAEVVGGMEEAAVYIMKYLWMMVEPMLLRDREALLQVYGSPKIL